MLCIRIVLSSSIILMAMPSPSHAQVPGMSHAVPSPQATKERTAHVGEVLPAGIELNLDDGRVVDLREHLQGPVIVVKLPNIDSLDTVFEAIRESRGQSLDDTRTPIAVIIIADKERKPLDLPDSVRVFRTTGMLEDGFLGGRLMPNTFYFDRNLRLIGRRFGQSPNDARALLYFPTE